MICNKCGSDKIKIVEDRSRWNFPFKVKLLVYGILIFLIALCIGLLFVNVIAAIITFFVSFGVFTIVLKLMIEYLHSKRRNTRTKCICKNCGNIWYLN